MSYSRSQRHITRIAGVFVAHNWAFAHPNDQEVPMGSRHTLFEPMMQTHYLVASFLFCFCDDKLICATLKPSYVSKHMALVKQKTGPYFSIELSKLLKEAFKLVHKIAKAL